MITKELESKVINNSLEDLVSNFPTYGKEGVGSKVTLLRKPTVFFSHMTPGTTIQNKKSNNKEFSHEFK